MVLKTSSNNSAIRVLVVDDHPNTATTMVRAISQLGPEVEAISAESGEEALEVVKDRPVDLLITDMVMPGVTGLELIELMRAHPCGRPAYIALMTAYDVPGLKMTAQRLKVNEVINKPVRPERICQIVAKAIEDLGHTPVTKQAPAKPQLKILVADDVQDNISLLSRYLENEGYTCLSASNGIEALARTRAEMPDLVLMDVSMPVKDGFEALQEMRADLAISHIPVIILTAAKIEPMDMQYALSIGADDYVTKPFDRRELLARIRTRLRVKEAEDTIRRRNKELNLLPEIGRELSGRLDVDELIDVVLRRTVETLGAFSGHILLQEPKGLLQKDYYFPTGSAPSPQMQPSRLREVLEQIRENRQGFIVQDTLKDNRWQIFPVELARSLVIIPMFGRHHVLGLLALTHEQAGYFTLEHKLLLQAIASQASIAIENAQLSAGMEMERQFMLTVLQNSEDVILLFNDAKQLSQINPAGISFFGKDKLRIGQPLPNSDGFDQIKTLLDIASSINNTASGRVIWPDKQLFNVFVSPTEEGAYAMILHNTSPLRSREEMNSDFVIKTAHNLRNPLTVIGLANQMLAKDAHLTERQSEIVQRIRDSVKTLDELVQNMLDSIQANEVEQVLVLEEVDVNIIASEIADEFQLQAESRGLNFELEKTEKASIVQGNSFQLRLALRNLAENALLYTSSGGEVCLSVETTGNEAVIRMRDSGYGILEDDLPHIFDRFYRGHSREVEEVKGSGLGLWIVKEITEKHHGRVEVQSDYGEGSCFTIYLPLAQSSDQSS